MATGTEFSTKDELLDSVKAKVFPNNSFAITGQKLQQGLLDMVESLWRDFAGTSNLVSTTYADLSTAISGGTLVPGTWYSFEFNNIHSVYNTTLANTETPGYTAAPETFLVVATSASTINSMALSVNNPFDIIHYSPIQSTHGTSLIADNGKVLKRHDVENDVEAYFDIRNFIVMRQNVSTAGVPNTATVDRGDIIYDGLWKVSIRDGSDKNNFRLVDDISQFSAYGAMHAAGGNNVQVLSQVFSADGSSVYTQAISGTNAGVKLGKNVLNTKITNCLYTEIGGNSTNITLESCNTVSIGSFNTDIVIRQGNKIKFGTSCLRTMIFNSNRIDIKDEATNCYLYQSDDIEIGFKALDILCLSSDKNTFSNNSQYLYLIRGANDNKFGSSCGAISLGNSVNNDFASDCTDIDIYSGGWNRFAQGCNVINLLGELDNAYTGDNTQLDGFGAPAGTNYYSPYSEMAYNTFGVGCSNITFNILGGRGNQFGDECKNLSFTTGVAADPWRLIGTNWVRGIQNKTFRSVIHGISFLVPCQETQTITENDWYAQVIHNRQVNIGGYFSVEISEDDVADSTDYTVALTGLTTSTTPKPPITATFNSGVGATKSSITAGLKTAISTAGGIFVTTKTLGDKIMFSASEYEVDLVTTTSNVFILNQGPLQNLEGVDFQNQPTIDRVYRQSLISVKYNNIWQTYVTSDIDGTGYDFRTGSVGTYPNVVSPEPLTAKAFMFTSNGYPLTMTMSSGLPKGLDPTSSLNNPLS